MTKIVKFPDPVSPDKCRPGDPGTVTTADGDVFVLPMDDWPAWFPATPADVERGEELFIGGYTWTLCGDDGPKHYRYNEGRWYRVQDAAVSHS